MFYDNLPCHLREYHCKDCTERHSGCHSICEKYKADIQKHNEEAEKVREERSRYASTMTAAQYRAYRNADDDKKRNRRHMNAERS